jgi:hypothetical protein
MSARETPDYFLDEEKKMRRLRVIVDLTAAVLYQQDVDIDEALDMINATKRTVLRLFPDKEITYDLIYGRRFERILRDRFGQCRSEEDNCQRFEPHN